jgi:hypothetical protein
MENKSTVLDEFILVVKYDRIDKRENSPFQQTVSNNNLGIVIESADESFNIGDRVYFLGQYERVIIDSADVLVMKKANIFKVIPNEEISQK